MLVTGRRFKLINTIAIDSVPVIILAGQSNAEGQPPIYELYTPYKQANVTSNWKILNASNNTFEVLNLGTNNTGSTASTVRAGAEAPLLANLSKSYPGQDVYLVKYAVGATPLYQTGNLSNWNASTTGGLLDTLITRINVAKAAIISLGKTPVFYFVWIQGESDAWEGRTATQYQNDYNALLAKIKTNCGISTMKVAIWQESINQQNVDSGNRAAIRTAQANIEATDPTYTKLINLDAYALRDPYHYNHDALSYGSEQSVNWFTGATPYVSTPITIPPYHINFTKAGWEEVAPNSYFGGGTGDLTTYPAIIGGVGGRYIIKNMAGSGTMSLRDGGYGASNIFTAYNGSGMVFTQSASTLYTDSIGATYYSLTVEVDGTVRFQKSSDGNTWSTLYSVPYTVRDWYFDMGSTFHDVTMGEVTVRPLI